MAKLLHYSIAGNVVTLVIITDAGNRESVTFNNKDVETMRNGLAVEQLRALDGACRPLIGRNVKPTNVCACGGSHEPPRQ